MRTVEFGSLFEFIRNGMSIKQDKSGEGLPITRIETISEAVVDSSKVGYADLREENCKGWLLQPGDILFSHINSVEHLGKCAIYEGSPEKLVHGMNLLCLRPDKLKLNPQFGKYLIRSSAFRSRLSNYINKSVNQASVSIGNLKPIEVYLPPLPEQKRIAAILDKADSIRRNRLEAVRLTEELLRSVFLDMFGDPVTNPKEWEISPVGSFVKSVTNGLTRRRKEVENGRDVVLRLREIRQGWIDFSELNRITLTQEESNRFRVEVGNLLFIRVNGNPDYVGRCAIFDGFSEEVFFNDHVMCVKPDYSKINGIFLVHVLNGIRGKQEIAQHRKTSAGQHTINQQGLSKVTIPLPPLNLQAEFERRIRKITKLSDIHKHSTKEFERLFNALLQRAFKQDL